MFLPSSASLKRFFTNAPAADSETWSFYSSRPNRWVNCLAIDVSVAAPRKTILGEVSPSLAIESHQVSLEDMRFDPTQLGYASSLYTNGIPARAEKASAVVL